MWCFARDGTGWARSHNPPKRGFSRIFKKLCEKMLWEWAEKLWTRCSLEALSNPGHSGSTTVCKLASCVGVPRSGQFMSGGKRRATSPAVFLMVFEGSWAVLGLPLGCWILFIYLFIKFESKVGLKAVCFAFNQKSAELL